MASIDEDNIKFAAGLISIGGVAITLTRSFAKLEADVAKQAADSKAVAEKQDKDSKAAAERQEKVAEKLAADLDKVAEKLSWKVDFLGAKIDFVMMFSLGAALVFLAIVGTRFFDGKFA